MTNAAFETREAWLKAAEMIMARWIEVEGHSYPSTTRVACGFPKRSKGRGTAIGQCWSNVVSADRHFEMFICPTLGDGMDACAVLIHEMVHATVGIKEGHNKVFGKLARALGLEGKLSATVAGADLRDLIQTQVLDVLGAYPHAALNARGGDSEGPKKAKTYLTKCECGDCGYIAYTTRKWLDSAGSPVCPSCEIAMTVGGE